ncbi:peptidoglycan DD-metalloendopeptidase family protein [Clostridium sp. MCC353]|uniref:M23 family metallopeptidase n=1 Tax=Clostridium sp. MCC353 TaxID=2592646 RepID=UPI001C0331FC|nr:M23 family metallopeptidase [Clostridium sp. MCC353]MBT9775832.1 peptidoglycan DD-metalloendopeptidase family protein [Clostridium sp. MCC353]
MSRKIIYIECLLLLMLTGSLLWHRVAPYPSDSANTNTATSSDAPKYIKWVDFDVTSDAMKMALQLDMNSYQKEVHLDWIDLLAYLGAKYGGDFSKYRSQDMKDFAEKLQNGESLETLTKDMKYFSYYKEAYGAVLGGMVGLYEIQVPPSEVPASMLTESADGEENESEQVWLTKYGLKAFSPIAKNFPYTDFDDFGTSRSYGYRRQHLGHDLMGQVGTPVIAVESGYVEAIGWNQYGGWRLGIRSFDKKRYYYYAHLRKNYPYHKSLKEGSIVKAGDVIGYLGRTGYSSTENTNNIDEPHLHFGLQLIFDESQKEGNNEIWVDCYELVKFLSMNRSETIKNQETKEYNRVYDMKDPVINTYSQ